MKKMMAFFLLLAAPLMAQHATQFAYYTTDICQGIARPKSNSSSESTDSQESAPPNPYSGIIWDPETQVSTEGFSLEGAGTVQLFCEKTEITGPNTIHIHHAGWYFAKFLITAEDAEPNTPGAFNFGLLNVNDLTIIPFSVYGVVPNNNATEQLAGQVVFYAPADTRIQLVNDGSEGVGVNGTDNTITSLYLFELLGR